MRKYLSELHTKPRHHKKRFAMIVSGVVTLAIFSIWSSVKFGVKPIVVKENSGPVNLAATVSQNGLDKVFDGIGNSWKSLLNGNDK